MSLNFEAVSDSRDLIVRDGSETRAQQSKNVSLLISSFGNGVWLPRANIGRIPSAHHPGLNLRANFEPLGPFILVPKSQCSEPTLWALRLKLKAKCGGRRCQLLMDWINRR